MQIAGEKSNRTELSDEDEQKKKKNFVVLGLIAQQLLLVGGHCKFYIFFR